jgi:hypothetical protein
MTSIRLEFTTVEEFRLGLQPVVQEVTDMLNDMNDLDARPALGNFEDAWWTAGRHSDLRDGVISRLHQLVAELTAFQRGNEEAIASLQQHEQATANAVDGVAGPGAGHGPAGDGAGSGAGPASTELV